MLDAVAIHHKFLPSPLSNFYSFDTKSKNKMPCIILVQFGMSHDDDLHIWAVRLLEERAMPFLNIYMYNFRWWHKKASDRKYSTQCKRITMMHFIVSKEQITYLKNTIYMMKVYNPHYICAHPSHIYVSQHICTYTHVHKTCIA